MRKPIQLFLPLFFGKLKGPIEPVGTPPDKDGVPTGTYRKYPQKINIGIKGSKILGVGYILLIPNSEYLDKQLRIIGGDSKEIQQIASFIKREIEDLYYNNDGELCINFALESSGDKANEKQLTELKNFFLKKCLPNRVLQKLLKDIKRGNAKIDKDSEAYKAFDLQRTEEWERQYQDIQKELKAKEKELKRREEEFKKQQAKKAKFRRPGHLTDQILKYDYPKGKSSQLSIFDSLLDSTKKKIETTGTIERTEIAEGIKLSPSETKVIDSLCKLLHERSQNLEPDKTDYYTGNSGSEMVEYVNGEKTPAPKLAFTIYELTMEYSGGEKIGGKDVANVKQVLQNLGNKNFLLRYTETIKTKGGGRIENKIERWSKLIEILELSQTEYSNEDIEISKKEETVILLNPIFRRQIDRKFILYPLDINRRTQLAYGSAHLSEITLRLRDLLMRELSSKRYQPEISLDKLYYQLAEKWMKESRKKKVKEFTDKALETCKVLGLLQSWEITTNVKGEAKIVFTLNKDWE